MAMSVEEMFASEAGIEEVASWVWDRHPHLSEEEMFAKAMALVRGEEVGMLQALVERPGGVSSSPVDQRPSWPGGRFRRRSTTTPCERRAAEDVLPRPPWRELVRELEAAGLGPDSVTVPAPGCPDDLADVLAAEDSALESRRALRCLWAAGRLVGFDTEAGGLPIPYDRRLREILSVGPALPELQIELRWRESGTLAFEHQLRAWSGTTCYQLDPNEDEDWTDAAGLVALANRVISRESAQAWGCGVGVGGGDGGVFFHISLDQSAHVLHAPPLAALWCAVRFGLPLGYPSAA